MTREGLHDAASALYGARWHRALAKALGSHHPAGARATLDPRLVGRWASGDRPIPAWVAPAIATLVQSRRDRLASIPLTA